MTLKAGGSITWSLYMTDLPFRCAVLILTSGPPVPVVMPQPILKEKFYNVIIEEKVSKMSGQKG